MKKSLIFHGFPKSKQSFERWDECKSMIEKCLNECGLKNCKIDRAHRVEGRQSNTLSPRPVYTESTSWDNANKILSNANANACFSWLQTYCQSRATFLKGNHGKEKELTKDKTKPSCCFIHINSRLGFRRYKFDAQDLKKAQDYFDSKN